MSTRNRVEAETGLDKFNRIGTFTNVGFHAIFILLALVCLVPVLVVLSISLSRIAGARIAATSLLQSR
ncbi:hypothetical protein [Cohnella fermenti]|uniref:hypothetical protein n=1 Tax=Cohnella fermenti TaxID=2565925 RepID=UPI001B3B2593|nr:hypothetical protein [Cohnella fermenti]